MEDPDWIEIAYLFDEKPSLEAYKVLFNSLPQNPGPEYDAREFDIRYTDQDDGQDRSIFAESDKAVEALTTSEYCSVEVWLDRYGIDIGFDKNGLGSPNYSATPYLNFATTIYSFQNSDDNRNLEEYKERRREFVEILSQSANILEPKWGFGRRGGLAIGENETVEELADRTCPPLYEYNVFRSETVEAIGRDRVLSAPAWYVEELASGGVFMTVREPPKQCAPHIEACTDVAEHLGLELATPERYH